MISIGTIPHDLLGEMERALSPEDAAEMAIPSYRHKNPLLRSMAWWRVHALGGFLDRAAQNGPSRPRVLDFGCGCGVQFERASRYAERIYGVDVVLGAARILVERRVLDRVTLLTPDEARAQIEPGSIDILLAGEVLEHIEPLGETLEWLRTRLARGGRMLVSLPTENAVYRLGRKLAGFSGHYHHSDASRIDAEIRQGGFEAVRTSQIPLGGPLSVYWIIEYRLRDTA